MTPRAGQSLGGRPVTETVTPVNVGNQPHCDNGEGVATASPLPSRLKTASIWRLPFQPSATRTTILPLLIPAVNCWAIIIRPLRGLTQPLFVQSCPAVILDSLLLLNLFLITLFALEQLCVW